jgi:hypothetical protein
MAARTPGGNERPIVDIATSQKEGCHGLRQPCELLDVGRHLAARLWPAHNQGLSERLSISCRHLTGSFANCVLFDHSMAACGLEAARLLRGHTLIILAFSVG